jgi:protein-S-isoprenylcysteine O-methyltransferase Ste14
MSNSVLCLVICACIGIVNGVFIVEGLRKGIVSEVFIHSGFILFFSLLALELTLGNMGLWPRLGLHWLRMIGNILYVPSAVLVIASLISLKHKGRPESADPTSTSVFVDTGIYRIIRQPMTLGMGIWSIALIFIFQSFLSLFFGGMSLFCFWMSARKEATYNLKKFGDDYLHYMRRVPMWNLFKGLKKK